MAYIRKVTKVANPHHRRRRRNGRKNARVHRNRLGRFVKRSARKRTKRVNARKKRVHNRRRANTTPAIRRYSVKAIRKELKRRGVKRNPARRRSNPVLIELGALNPRRRSNVAKTRKRRRNRRRVTAVARVHHRRRRRSNPVSHRRHRRRNRTRVYNRRRHTNRRRNPMLFGRSSGKDLLYMVGGGLVGVAATKYLPTLLPTSITSMGGGSPIVSVIITGAGAFVAGMLARKFMGEPFGDAVLFGGLMQTGSALLTAFAPASLSSQLALSGVGDIVPGYFAVPQNPVTNRAPVLAMPAPASGGGGMGWARTGNFRRL